jgi:glycosyltransferase involved in cell wall biosynthesis
MEIVINGRFLTQNVTGVQRYARELVQALDAILDTKPELNVTVMSPRLVETPQAWRNIELRQVGYLQGHAWEQFELPWHSRGKALFCPGNTAPAISLLSGQRVIVTVHDLSYLYFPDAYSRQFRLWYNIIIPLALRRATTVITVSQSERCAILTHYPDVGPRLFSIQNGGLPAELPAQAIEAADCDRGYILYVGSLSRRKNIQGALNVASRLVRKRDFRFVFVGGTAGGIRYSDFAAPSDVAERITMVGQVDDLSALISYYRRAECLLFPSFYEASPLPPLEAMACGCPVVASDIPALKERCGDAAIYCDPNSIDSMCAAVLRVMDDAELHAKLRALGYQRAANYTWKACAQDTLDLICRC